MKFTWWSMQEPYPSSRNRNFILFLAIGCILFIAILGGCYIASRPPQAAVEVPPSTPPATGAAQLPIQETTPTGTPVVSLPIVVVQEPDTPAPTLTVTATPEQAIVFAVIGDYGSGNHNEADVAALVESWHPDFVITTGDNNYPSGQQTTIDAHIGQFYHEYIHPYHGDFGKGADQNRFFPTLGNHDWMVSGAKPYLDYFTLPGNERYYEFTWGPVDFFAVDADSNEPNGVNASSKQAKWLEEHLASATSPWKIVYFHQPPYSSGLHGSTTWMRWPFKEWGATAVLSGHDHTYERLSVGGLPYFVNGIGGGAIYQFENVLDQSQVRYNADYGAMRVEATSTRITFQFINRSGDVIDTYEITP